MGELPDKALLRVGEVAAYFSVKPRTVYGWIESGKMEAVKIVGSVRISQEEVKKRLVLSR